MTRPRRVQTVYERSVPGRRASSFDELDVPRRPLGGVLPADQLRDEPAALPELSEPELVRHFHGLSRQNYCLDDGPYPLGSCTMKYPPKLRERLVSLPGFARLHPLQAADGSQGALEVMWGLQCALAEIAGLPHVTLQPAAGAHGELTGLLMTRALHESTGETRTRVLAPTTAHGTNPATITMAGYETVSVAAAPDGGIDLEDLRGKADETVACMMLTNPSTLGLFERNIAEVAEIVREAGATLYYDGANLNPIMGVCRPGDMGFDIVHFNLHKSFGQPHGGGGPGAGPIAVSDRLGRFLPVPVVARTDDGTFELDDDRPASIGRMRGFHGSFAVLASAYAYILRLGADGLRDAAEGSVLNANYLLARVRELGIDRYLPPVHDRHCMHEFVLTGQPLRRATGLRAQDFAKRLLDHGVHPPTVAFPITVPEALMIEPTETETCEALDAYAQAIADVLEEAALDAEVARSAPHTTPVGRLDEVRAVRNPVLRQPA